MGEKLFEPHNPVIFPDLFILKRIVGGWDLFDGVISAKAPADIHAHKYRPRTAWYYVYIGDIKNAPKIHVNYKLIKNSRLKAKIFIFTNETFWFC